MNLRICSYNIQRGVHLPELASGFLSDARVRAADLISVQEAGVTGGGRNVLEEITRLLGPPYRWLYAPVMKYPGKEYGNGFIYGPALEPVRGHALPLPQVSSLGWLERKKTEGGRPDTKAAFIQLFSFQRIGLRVSNVHMDFVGGASHRARQLCAVLDDLDGPGDLRSGDGDAVVDVICGDFNTSGLRPARWSRAVVRRVVAEAERRGFMDCTAHVPWTSDMLASLDPGDPAFTWMRLASRIGLRYRQKHDHILVRGPVRVVASGSLAGIASGHLPGSDHIPLFADLEV